jgi:hypothetical protein
MLILSVVCLYVQKWHLADARWRCRERRLVGSRRDCRGERDVGVRTSRGDQLIWRGQRGGADLMTLVLGHHTLLWRLPEWILRIYVVGWRRYCRTCLRAYGLAFRMRRSWSSVWGFCRHGGPSCDKQQWLRR